MSHYRIECPACDGDGQIIWDSQDPSHVGPAAIDDCYLCYSNGYVLKGDGCELCDGKGIHIPKERHDPNPDVSQEYHWAECEGCGV